MLGLGNLRKVVLHMKKLSCMTITLALLLGIAPPTYAELFPDSGPPGTTVTIGGNDFGKFVSTAENRVEFNGIPALVQLWEKDLIMVKVPYWTL